MRWVPPGGCGRPLEYALAPREGRSRRELPRAVICGVVAVTARGNWRCRKAVATRREVADKSFALACMLRRSCGREKSNRRSYHSRRISVDAELHLLCLNVEGVAIQKLESSNSRTLAEALEAVTKALADSTLDPPLFLSYPSSICRGRSSPCTFVDFLKGLFTFFFSFMSFLNNS